MTTSDRVQPVSLRSEPIVTTEERVVNRSGARRLSPGEPSAPDLNSEETAAAVLAKRTAFLGITEEDCARVRALRPAFLAFADQFVERFYAHLFSFPATAIFLQNPELVERLRTSQKRYFESLLDADLSADYVEGRRRIGRAHAEVALEPQLFLGAFNQYIQHCFHYFAAQPNATSEENLAGMLSLLKFILLDVGLALDAYFAESTNQLRKALELYAQSNTELREFAHLTSHDLKTPLATVSALCEEFLDEFGPGVPEEGRRLIEAARGRAMKMKDMISELLEASEAAAQADQRTNISTGVLLDEVLDRVRMEMGDRPIQIDMPDKLPEVYAHPGRLREVFYHLLSNAVKFMDKRPGMIRVSAEKVGSEQVFCVSDNGPGIASSDQSKVFAPFQRLPQHRHVPGSGLGLYFVRKIVEEQGGRVWVESQLGEGSRFFVALPAGTSAPATRR